MESQSPQWRDHALAVEEGGLDFASSCCKKQRRDIYGRIGHRLRNMCCMGCLCLFEDS